MDMAVRLHIILSNHLFVHRLSSGMTLTETFQDYSGYHRFNPL